MNLARRAVRGTAITLAGSYTNMGLGLVYSILMARLLEPEHFGLFAGAAFVLALVDVRGKLGLDYAFIHRRPDVSPLLATHWLMQMGAALLTLLLALAAAGLATRLGYPAAAAPLILALAGAALVEAAGASARAALEKELAFAWSAAVVTGALALSYAAALAFAARGFGVWALVVQAAVQAACASLGFWWAYRQAAPRPSLRLAFDRDHAAWLLRFGAALAVGAIAMVILTRFDNFLVLTVAGSAVAGYYVQAYKVAQWPTGLVTHVVARVSLPTYAQLQEDRARLSKAFEFSLWLILTTAVPLALAVFVTAPDFLTLLWGEKWLPSAALLRCLIAYSVLRPLLDDTGALFVAVGQPRRITLVLVVQAAALLAAAPPLTLAYGAVGTALGVGISFALGIALTYRYVSQMLSINLLRVFLPPALAAAGSLALYWGLARLIDWNLLPLLLRVFAQGACVAALFFGLALLLDPGGMRRRVAYLSGLL